MLKSLTHTISIDAPPDRILDLVGDPVMLPSWAPDFARAVELDGDDCIAMTAGGPARIRVRVSREHGTVDFLAAEALEQGMELGAFSRAVRRGAGSEFIFTVMLDADARAEAVAEQQQILEQELERVRSLCEPR